MKRFKSIVMLAAAATIATLGMESHAAPAWWAERGALTNTPASDYSPVVLGQLKWMAACAYAEMTNRVAVPGVSWDEIQGRMDEFDSLDNWLLANVGQLKYVAAPFHQRLIEIGAETGSPWTVTSTDDVDFAMLNLGQLKNTFDFEPDVASGDGDLDGMPDWWERVVLGGTETDGSGDLDHDGWMDIYEFLGGSDPTDAGSVPALGDADDDRLPDWAETGTGLYLGPANTGSSASDADSDDDGVNDGVEVAARTDPNMADITAPVIRIMASTELASGALVP